MNYMKAHLEGIAEEFADSSFVEELDKSGFIKQLVLHRGSLRRSFVLRLIRRRCCLSWRRSPAEKR